MASKQETREQILHRLATGQITDSGILADFQDTEELVDVALRLCLKRCVQIVFDNTVSPMHQVSATRLIAQIRYKGLSEEDGSGSGDKDLSSGMRSKDIETLKSAIGKVQK